MITVSPLFWWWPFSSPYSVDWELKEAGVKGRCGVSWPVTCHSLLCLQEILLSASNVVEIFALCVVFDFLVDLGVHVVWACPLACLHNFCRSFLGFSFPVWCRCAVWPVCLSGLVAVCSRTPWGRAWLAECYQSRFCGVQTVKNVQGGCKWGGGLKTVAVITFWV